MATLLISACDRKEPQSARSERARTSESVLPATPADPPPAPGDKPPSTQPGQQPDPSVSPASRPASAAAASPSSFQPLLDAQVGEIAEYRNALNQTMRYEVIEARSDMVVLRVTMFDERGQIIGQPTRREERRDLDPLVQHARKYKTTALYRQEVIDVAGKRWDAMLCESRWNDPDGVSLLRKTWVSSKVPVLGLLRMELYAQEGDGPQQLDSKLELLHTSQPGA